MSKKRTLRETARLEDAKRSKCLLLFVLIYSVSGFCVLALETLWTRALTLSIGNTVLSATAVLCAFFFFAAIGNLIGGWWTRRTQRPALWYGVFEICFGLSAGVMYWLGESLGGSFCKLGIEAPPLRLSIAHGIYVSCMVGVPSLFAGTTFPLLSQVFISNRDRRTRTGGSLYGGNLAGAALGAVIGGIFLPYYLGYTQTVLIVSAASVAIGIMAILAKPDAFIATTVVDNKPQDAKEADHRRDFHRVLGWSIIIGSGILSLALETLTFTYFRLFAVSSVYNVAAVLLAFLLGLGGGTLLATWLRAKGFRTDILLTVFLCATAVLCCIYPYLFQKILIDEWFRVKPVSSKEWMFGLAMGIIIKATLVLLPLLVCVGTVFPLAWEICARGQAGQGTALGRIVAMNKLGSALGAILAPCVFIPRIGLPQSLAALGGLYACGALVMGIHTAGDRRLRKPIVISLIAVFAVFGASYAFLPRPVVLLDGEKLIARYNGKSDIVTVIKDAQDSSHIVVNQNYILNGTGRAMLSQKHESWIPLFLNEHAENVAFIGMASGISAAAGLDFPIKHLDSIEIVPEVAKAAKEHFGRWNERLFTDPRSSVIHHDGRFVIQSGTRPLDVIICDLLLPAQDGTAAMYSRDFFQQAKTRLRDDGMFCLWLPLYQMDENMAGIVLRTFTGVFPNVIAVRSNFDPTQNTLGLIGSNHSFDLSDQFIHRRLSSEAVKRIAAESPFFRSPANVRLMLLGDMKAIEGDFKTYPENTDDRPAFVFQGARPIPNDEHLRALTYLKWFGKRFLDGRFPSCNLGGTPPAQLMNGARAGNYYFAAAISNAQINDDFDKQTARGRQMLNHMAFAKKLWPDAKMDVSDLDH